MAQIPDTSDIADALSKESNSPAAVAAVNRLRVLHQLGATQASVEAGLRQQVGALIAERDQARAERDARPTAAELAEVEAERDRLQSQLADLLAPPSGPFAVPIVQFRAGLIGLRLALLSAPEQVRAKWNAILPELDILTVVYPREEPVASLLAEAVSDNLLSPAEALALRGGE